MSILSLLGVRSPNRERKVLDITNLSHVEKDIVRSAFGGLGETINAQSGTTYTLQASDNGKIVTFSNGSPVEITIPAGLGSFSCAVVQLGAGEVSFTASGTTLLSFGDSVALGGQYASGALFTVNEDVFLLTGTLA